MIQIPSDLDSVLDVAWARTKITPGFLLENEARFLGIAAACTPGEGAIVEIGSFKGRSTVMLATVAARYGLGPVVSIDPHNFNLTVDNKPGAVQEGSTYEEFMGSLRKAGVEQQVEVHHAFSKDVSATWNRPIRLLWIDGDHSLQGATEDFEGFSPLLSPGGVVAIHDSLHAFAGPIGVFVELILRSSKYGPAGFVQSTAWAQYRPKDGNRFNPSRRALYRRAAKLLPYVKEGTPLKGVRKLMYKLYRSRVPRAGLSPEAWATMLEA
jgi:hypothetical protein